MSDHLLHFLSLSEIRTVRLVCRREGCGAVVELPIEQLESRLLNGCCPLCQAPFNVIDQTLDSPLPAVRGVSWLRILAFAVTALRGANVDVVFVVPGKDVCRLDRLDRKD